MYMTLTYLGESDGILTLRRSQSIAFIQILKRENKVVFTGLGILNAEHMSVWLKEGVL